ncbi:MAG: SET domain-containing protein [Candidatus Binatia bacterium]
MKAAKKSRHRIGASGSRSKTQRRFSVRYSPIHGRGVFALSHIPKRTRLLEYTGERISHEEADRRYAAEHEYSPHTMLFTVNDDIVIDATERGSSARWFNHSCSPNCEVEDEDDRIFIETRKDVWPGEELTYDYNLQLGEPHTAAAKKENPCYCGSRRCRGTLLGEEE